MQRRNGFPQTDRYVRAVPPLPAAGLSQRDNHYLVWAFATGDGNAHALWHWQGLEVDDEDEEDEWVGFIERFS